MGDTANPVPSRYWLPLSPRSGGGGWGVGVLLPAALCKGGEVSTNTPNKVGIANNIGD